MTHSSADASEVGVGVLLAPSTDELGEWLADAAAFESAGADALWIDCAPESGLDPLALAAALAALTFRSLLVVVLPEGEGSPEPLARPLATIGRLSHGRLALAAEFDRLDELAAPPGLAVFHRIPEEPEAFERTREDGQTERWIPVPSPEGRAAWRAARHEAAERGDRGLLVPADPRLLDILRNPEDPGGRHDLRLAQG
ncbi:MAG: LLM class flavin-dependent oxidoreductase [Streptosporangiales bacterium]|nr:LLM class flavin-dependent oxidoreductase [Streptosporangiales bacterium]